MTLREEVKNCLAQNLEQILDGYMSSVGFVRLKTALLYTRRLSVATQTIDLALQIHPKDSPQAAAAVYPQMKVLMPATDDVLAKMVAGDLGLLEGFTCGTTAQPIGFTSEKNHPGRWLVFQADSVPGIVEDVQKFLQRWTVPLLDVYTTAEDIVAADRRGDGRIARDRAQTLRVVAAAIVTNQQDYASEVMNRSFGSPGLRRRYHSVFEFIGKL